MTLIEQALRRLVCAVEPYAGAPTHATPKGTRSNVKRELARARRALSGDETATCGHPHKGFICARPLYHSGKHRHSERANESPTSHGGIGSSGVEGGNRA